MRIIAYVVITDYQTNDEIVQRESVVSLYCANGEDFLLIRNPLFKDGIRYKISVENILRLSIGGAFTRKLTMILREPPHQLGIYNATRLLQRLAKLVFHLREPKCLPFNENPPVIPKEIYDFNTLSQNLTILKIENVKMDTLPLSLSRLQNIMHLEIAHCGLIEIPAFIGDLPHLESLLLAYNKLGAQRSWDFLARPDMKRNLSILDLQHNELMTIPNEVLNLESLEVLLLDDNHLVSIPTRLKEMDTLSVLTVSSNNMRIFPYNLFPLPGIFLVLSNNPFTSRYFVTSNKECIHEVPTLKELAARAVIDHRVTVPEHRIPQIVVDFLKSVRFCGVCAGAYFETYIPCCYIPLFRIYTDLDIENDHFDDDVYVLNVCSRRCMKPNLKQCEVISHLTPEQYDDLIGDLP